MTDEVVKGVSIPAYMLKGMHIIIIRTRWNDRVVSALTEACKKKLEEMQAFVSIFYVPGAFELPAAVARAKNESDGVVAIGCLIKGDTDHYEMIAESVTHRLQELNTLITPVIFGVLTCRNELQALQRAGLQAGSHNHGEDWALSMGDMLRLQQDMSSRLGGDNFDPYRKAKRERLEHLGYL